MCSVLNITRQNYYKYRNTIDKDYYDYLEIKRVFEEGDELYGAVRIKKALLRDTGWIVNLKKIRRIMKKYDIKVRYHKVFKKNTNKDRLEENVRPNLLKRNFYADKCVFLFDIIVNEIKSITFAAEF